MDKEKIIADMAAANANVTTITVKGKEYVMVNERIKAFRQVFPLGTIATEILEDTGERATVKAYAYDGDILLATGHAYEVKNSSYINKTSYIENCETSAVGRCLGFLGIGCDDSLASAEEVKNAIEAQDAIKAEEVARKKLTPARVKAFRTWLKENGIDEAKMLAGIGLEKLEDVTEGLHKNIFEHRDDAVERWSK